MGKNEHLEWGNAKTVVRFMLRRRREGVKMGGLSEEMQKVVTEKSEKGRQIYVMNERGWDIKHD